MPPPHSTSHLRGREDEDYLYDYVRNMQDCYGNENCRDAINRFINEDGKVAEKDILVYRGHYGRSSNNIDPKKDWFSVSTSKKVAAGFTGTAGHLFRIHLMKGVKYLEVNKKIASLKYSTKDVYSYEEEYLVKGGGKFYSIDATGNVKAGFMKVEPEGANEKRDSIINVYEGWYFPAKVDTEEKAKKKLLKWKINEIRRKMMASRSRSKSGSKTPTRRLSRASSKQGTPTRKILTVSPRGSPKKKMQPPLTLVSWNTLVSRASEDNIGEGNYDKNNLNNVKILRSYLRTGEKLDI